MTETKPSHVFPFLILIVFLLCFSLPVVADSYEVPLEEILVLLRNRTNASAGVILQGLSHSSTQVRLEALLQLQNFPAPGFGEQSESLIAAVADNLTNASMSVRIEAVRSPVLRFPKEPRSQEMLRSVSTKTLPPSIIRWAWDEILTKGAGQKQAEMVVQKLTREAENKLREWLKTHSLDESSALTKQWLLNNPAVQTVEVSRDLLWFSTHDGQKSGLLLNTYKRLKKTASASTSTDR